MKLNKTQYITKDGIVKNLPKRCSICLQKYEGFGNNAYPINGGRCCDICDAEVVVPARIRNYMDHGTTN